MEQTRLSYGSLFTGIAGFDLGFDRAGMVGAWQIEKDKDCNRVLGKHYPKTKRGNDVREVTTERFERVDVICGGFPCQDVSVAGKRAGLAGERSGLWHEFHRVIAEFAPRVCVIENVPGLLSSHEGGDMLTIVRGLAELGYRIAWGVLDSQYRGVAQRRDRVFIIGSLGNGSCAEILFESESVRGDSPPSRETGQSVTGTLGARTTAGGGLGTDFECDGGVVSCLDSRANVDRGDHNHNSKLVVAATVSSKWAKGSGGPADDECQNLVAHTLRGEGFDASEDGTGRGTPLIAFSSKDSGADAEEDIAPTMRSMNFDKSHINGGGQVAVAYRTAGNCGPFEQGDKTGALNTATDPNQTILRHGVMVRRLTPRECERLQGFPDDWTRWDADGKEISDSARYRMLGNAVTVSVAEWIGKQIVAICLVWHRKPVSASG